MSWDAITAVSSAVSMVAFVLTALYIRDQVRGLEKDRFLNVTNELFTTWQGREFMLDQMWLLHRLEETEWAEFVAKHRGDTGEVAFHRVGAFYDRVGTLVRLGLINDREILQTISGHAIAVWNKIEPLVRGARGVEHSALFADFEKLLPACHECYVPSLGQGARARPFTPSPPDPKVSVKELKRLLDAREPVTVLDVRRPEQVADDPRTVPGALVIPADGFESRLDELPRDREAVVLCA